MIVMMVVMILNERLRSHFLIRLSFFNNFLINYFILNMNWIDWDLQLLMVLFLCFLWLL